MMGYLIHAVVAAGLCIAVALVVWFVGGVSVTRASHLDSLNGHSKLTK